MFLFLVFLPLFNFIYVWILEVLIGKRKAIVVVAHSYVLLVILGIVSFWQICLEGSFYFYTLGTWINCSLFVVNWGFIFDSLSISMVLMVGIVSGSVHFYSLGYMSEDPCLVRFISYLSLFTFFMFILVTSDNFIQLFLGWEGIGLCSYLLISFWNTRVQANKAALKALVVNRIGDFGFICGVMIIFYFLRTVDFALVFSAAPYLVDTTMPILNKEFLALDLMCFFLFIGCMGKSAQLGLHTWLPDAMEGPTPVSALIHAATLVTAGVFLIIRCSPVFEFSPSVLVLIAFIGGSTSFFAATVAVAQEDIKKVIAYSTCSQLGYMIFICGLSSYNVSFFHLVNHAFFKALLFLGAGSVIHALSGEQDMRRFGISIKMVPYTYGMMLIGFLALAGFPFLSGFYSKDLILEISRTDSWYLSGTGFFTYWLGTLSAGLTAFYSFRVVVNTFFVPNNLFKYSAQHIHELPVNMGFALFVLSIGSIFSGYFLKDAFVGIGSTFWGNAIYVADKNSIALDFEFIPLSYKLLPLMLAFSGILFALFICKGYETFLFASVSTKGSTKQSFAYMPGLHGVVDFLNKKWYVDFLYNYYVGKSIFHHAYFTFYKLLDKGIIEYLGPEGISNTIYTVSRGFVKRQSGYIFNQSSILVLSFLLILYIVLII